MSVSQQHAAQAQRSITVEPVEDIGSQSAQYRAFPDDTQAQHNDAFGSFQGHDMNQDADAGAGTPRKALPRGPHTNKQSETPMQQHRLTSLMETDENGRQ